MLDRASERERLLAALDRHWKAWGEAMAAADVAKEAGDDAAEDAARRTAVDAVDAWFHYSAALREHDRIPSRSPQPARVGGSEA